MSTGDPVEALKRLSELDAVRILTIHKCKGLEFDKVVMLGVEEELFWGDAAMSEFFVAISRAKNELILTHADFRARPGTLSSTGGRPEPPKPSFWLTPTTPETTKGRMTTKLAVLESPHGKRSSGSAALGGFSSIAKKN